MHTIIRGLMCLICVGSVVGIMAPSLAFADSGRVLEIRHTPQVIVVRLAPPNNSSPIACIESKVLGAPPPASWSALKDGGYVGLPSNSPATPYWLSLLQVAQERHEVVNVEYDANKSCTITSLAFE